MKNYPVYRPLIEKEEIEAATQALELGWLGMGSYVGQFEEAVKDCINAGDRYVAAVSSGTAALHLGLLVAGIGRGDEVILPSFNFVAAAQAIIATGAEPVFCDVYDDTLCIDVEKAEELVSPRTKAIMPVDYSGNLSDHDGLTQLAEKYGLRIIHDAAHSFASKYNDKEIGSFSDVCVFSFDPIKTVTCIDGGILVVRSEEELNIIHEMRSVGMKQSTSVTYKNRRPVTRDVQRIGFRYHMANLHAAIGLAQLKKIDRIVKGRRAACLYYNGRLSRVSELILPNSDFKDVTPFIYCVRVPSEMLGSFRDYLGKNGIDTGCHWIPMHTFTFLKNYRKGDLSVTEKVGSEIVTLPLYPDMVKDEQDAIIEKIVSFFRV